MERAKLASLAWKDASFGPLIDRLTVHADRYQRTEQKSNIISLCDTYIQSADVDNLEAHINNLHAALPPIAARQALRLDEKDGQHTVWQTMDTMAKHLWASSSLPDMLKVIDAATRLKNTLELPVAKTDTLFLQRVQSTYLSLASGAQLMDLHRAVAAFVSTGQDFDSQMKAKNSLTRVKQIMVAQDRVVLDKLTDFLTNTPTRAQLDVKAMREQAEAIIVGYGAVYTEETWPRL